jgi:rubrerythrin
MAEQARLDDLNFGTEIYDEDGQELGHIRGFDENGFYVSFAEGLEGLSTEHVATGGAFGEAELMWRCWDCGALGTLDGEIPDGCPDCDAPREDLYYWVED